jgi:hypothetical protein
MYYITVYVHSNVYISDLNKFLFKTLQNFKLCLPVFRHMEGGGEELRHKRTINMISKEVFDKATFNKVNICTNQNETVVKLIQNIQKFIEKTITSYGF